MKHHRIHPSSAIHRPFQKAFTLMEMMLVLAIIAILIGIGAASLGSADETAKKVAAKAGISTVKTALISFKALNGGRLPNQSQGLEILVKSGKSGRQIMSPEGIVDPWGNTYKFVNPGKKSNDGYDIYSKGPDGNENTDDDIGNWTDK